MLKNNKKLLSLVLAMIIAFSCFSTGMVFAQENTPGNTPAVQSVQDDSDNMYSDFPIQIDKNIRKDMAMDMSFRYLKNISDNDCIEIIIENSDDNSLNINEILTPSNKRVTLNNVPNNTSFCVTLNETIDGNSTQYVRYIRTKFVKADFPVNLSLGDVEITNNNGEVYGEVLIKKVGNNPTCTHDGDTDCTEACSIGSVVQKIPENELYTFYEELDENAYYELQTQVSIGGKTELYQGFISTYSDGEYEGIFSRGYSVYENPEYADGVPSMCMSRTTPDLTNVYEYVYYQNVYARPLTYEDEIVIKFVPPVSGYYTIETIGNADTVFRVFRETNGVINSSYSTVRNGGVGENASFEMGFAISDTNHPILYIELTLEDGDSAPCAFRIIRDEDITYLDDFTNFRDEVQSDCENGIYSNAMNENCYIDYNGDVDILGFDISSGTGYIDFARITTFENDEEILEADIYSVSTEQSPFDSCWRDDTILTGAETQLTFSTGRYYIEIRQADNQLPTLGSDDYYDHADDYFRYKFNFYHPKYPDPLDIISEDNPHGNNYPMFATEAFSSGELSFERNDLTLHKGDKDYFSFEVGTAGANISAEIEVNDSITQAYDIVLYNRADMDIFSTDPVECTIPDTMADWEWFGENIKRLTYDGLEEGLYFIGVKRPNNNTYSSRRTYTLRINMTIPGTHTAVLSSNVNLTHAVGDDIISTVGFKNTIMQNLTCYSNNVEVSDSEAIEGVELYYNNSVLTPEIVNTMVSGTYSLTVKYNGVTATGGNINLVVSDSSGADDIVMLDNVPFEAVNTSVLDWGAVARIIANNRLIKNGQSPTTYTVRQGIIAVKGGASLNQRGTIEETVMAANYFYSGGNMNSWDFLSDAVDVSNAESILVNNLTGGNVVILQLTSVSNPSDVTAMRYIILYGINRTTHEYMVYDPAGGIYQTVSADTLYNGGYNGNQNIKFTGQIIAWE